MNNLSKKKNTHIFKEYLYFFKRINVYIFSTFYDHQVLSPNDTSVEWRYQAITVMYANLLLASR